MPRAQSRSLASSVMPSNVLRCLMEEVQPLSSVESFSQSPRAVVPPHSPIEPLLDLTAALPI